MRGDLDFKTTQLIRWIAKHAWIIHFVQSKLTVNFVDLISFLGQAQGYYFQDVGNFSTNTSFTEQYQQGRYLRSLFNYTVTNGFKSGLPYKVLPVG
jgi:hypothetical protein